jgi:hypothetical protein
MFHDERGFHEVAWFASIQQSRIPHLEGHRHPWHESANVFVPDRDLLPLTIDGENLASELVFASS